MKPIASWFQQTEYSSQSKHLKKTSSYQAITKESEGGI